MGEHLLIMTTVDSGDQAALLSRALVERKLVACVNVIGPVRSVYRWQGAVEDEPEHLLLMKTRRDRLDDVEAAVRELHPYDVPELLAIPIEAGAAAYLSWVDESTGKGN